MLFCVHSLNFFFLVINKSNTLSCLLHFYVTNVHFKQLDTVVDDINNLKSNMSAELELKCCI